MGNSNLQGRSALTDPFVTATSPTKPSAQESFTLKPSVCGTAVPGSAAGVTGRWFPAFGAPDSASCAVAVGGFGLGVEACGAGVETCGAGVEARSEEHTSELQSLMRI